MSLGATQQTGDADEGTICWNSLYSSFKNFPFKGKLPGNTRRQVPTTMWRSSMAMEKMEHFMGVSSTLW
jgi:hypothetical protein